MSCSSTAHDKEGLPADLIASDAAGERSLKVDADLPKTAFGEMSVAQPDPLVQISAQYGIRDNALIAALGGTCAAVDSNYVISSGTGANNVAALVSSDQAPYRAGQGLITRFTSVFDTPQENSTQVAGFLNSEVSFAFGYNGTDFGIVYGRGGALEIQELEITSGATSDETATITIDGAPYNVGITSSTATQNAYEISESLKLQVPGYTFSSHENVVECLAQLPDLGAGLFSLSSNTAVGVFTEITSGVIPAEAWVSKADWNVKPNIDIDPLLGNVYQIQLQYLGYGGIKFYIENPDTANFELVHIIKYANTSTKPSVKNPVFRVGWGVRNTGNTTNIELKGASAAIFIEGNIVVAGKKYGYGLTKAAVGTTLTSVIALRNRLTLFGLPNRARILLRAASLSTDTTKTGVYEIIKNPVTATGDFLDFVETGLELADIATNDAEIIGGETVAIFNIKAGQVLSSNVNTVNPILAGDVICFAARVTGGSSSEFDASISWQEDL